MVAALYSSGMKGFVNDCGVHFGWGTVEDVFRADLVRAKNGQSRRVPKLNTLTLFGMLGHVSMFHQQRLCRYKYCYVIFMSYVHYSNHTCLLLYKK